MSANTSEQALANLIKWLRNRHAEVMAAESQALARIDAGDTPGHNAHMRLKAELLASMAEDAKPLLIKRYASRRLYNTETSDYVTLEDIARRQ